MTKTLLCDGIAHLNDLEISKFIDTVRKLSNKDNSMELSVKFDGSANLGFGIDEDGKLYFDRAVKGQSEKKYGPNDWAAKPMYNPIRTAVAALLKNKHVLEKNMMPGEWTDCEIMFEAIPNAIEYGENYIVIHDAKFNSLVQKLKPTTVKIDIYLYDHNSKKIVKKVENITYKFSGKEVLNTKKYKISINADIDKLEKFMNSKNKKFRDNSNFEILIMRAAGKNKNSIKAEKEKLKAQISKMKLAIKDKLIEQILNRIAAGSMAKPPEFDDKGNNVGGTFPEGIVIKDLKTGDLSKIVSVFPEINKFLWFYRETASKGTGPAGKFVPGIMAKFKDEISLKAFGIKALRSVAVTSNIKKKYPNKPANLKLLTFLKNSGYDFKKVGQTKTKYLSAIKKAKKELNKLRKEFENKGQKDVLKVRHGKFKRDITYNDIAIRKTFETFLDIEHELDQYAREIQSINEHTREGTAVQILRVYLGQKNLNKLAENFLDIKTHMIMEAIKGSSVGVIIGRFQPPQNAHIKLINNAIKSNNRVYVFITGQKYDKDKNPFPFKLRKKIIEKAVGNNKLFIAPAKTGFLPELIEDTADLNSISNLNIYAGTDRVASYGSQMKNYWDHSAVSWKIKEMIRPANAVSATKVRAAIKNNDKKLFQKLVPRNVWNEWPNLVKHLKEYRIKKFVKTLFEQKTKKSA